MERKPLDSRARFQHSRFTRKLQEARSYKRTNRPRPEGKLQAGLQKVGLANVFLQLGIAGFLIFVCYLLYVPNFLFLKAVTVEGMSIEHQTEIEKNVIAYQKQIPWYMPTSNILFVDEQKMARYLAEKTPAISEVYSVDKKWKTASITIHAKQKHERYLIARPENWLVLYNDGTVKGAMLPDDAGMPQSGSVVVIATNDTSKVDETQTYMDQALIDLVEQSASRFTDNTGQNFMNMSITLEQPEGESKEDLLFRDEWKSGLVEAVVQKTTQHGKPNPANLRIIIDPGMDITAAADRLKLLLEQTPPERYKALLYADMRLPNRAYLCLINTLCATTNP